MISSALFLSFPLDQASTFAYEQIPVEKRDLIGCGLFEMEHQDKLYLAKEIPSPIKSSELWLAEAHLYSLLKKLLPDFSVENIPLELIAR